MECPERQGEGGLLHHKKLKVYLKYAIKREHFLVAILNSAMIVFKSAILVLKTYSMATSTLQM